MITPRDAETHVFSKASFGGYNMAQVDAFLDTLISDYSTLYKENATLKSKLKVLADKIEEYRSTEDAMRMTLLSAQKAADTMLREAEAKKNEVIQDAVSELEMRKSEVLHEIENEELRLHAAQESTAAYVNKLKDLYTHELDYIGHLSELVVPKAEEQVQPQDPPQPVQDTAKDIEDTMTKMFGDKPLDDQIPAAEEEEDAAAVCECIEASEQDGDANLSDTIQFDHLQFGRNYEFK